MLKIEIPKLREWFWKKINDPQKKIYYAHSLHFYDTTQELLDVSLLEQLGYDVINPNSEIFQREYSNWLISNKVKDSDKMIWFNGLIDKADVLAFRSHSDMRISSGVFYEIKYAIKNKIPVFEIPTFNLNREMSLKETREWLKNNKYN